MHLTQNNFVTDSDNGAITGSVKDDANTPLSGVKIELSQGTVVVATTLTDSNGLYEFTNLEPGSYTLSETNPVGYDKSVDPPLRCCWTMMSSSGLPTVALIKPAPAPHIISS